MPYVERVTRAGKTIEVERYFTSRYKKPGIKRGDKVKPTKEEQKKVNTRAAERKLRLLLNANFGYGDYHLELDYIRKKGQPDRSREQMRKDMDIFLRELRKECKKAGIDELQNVIEETGWTSEYKNGENQYGTKKSPEAETYIALSKNYAAIIKQLTELVPAAKRKQSKLAALREE